MKTEPDKNVLGIQIATNRERKEIPGLTKREYFSAMALQGLLANAKYDPSEYFVSLVGVWAVSYADKLIEALNKEKP